MRPIAMRSEMTNRAEGRVGNASTRSAAVMPSSICAPGTCTSHASGTFVPAAASVSRKPWTRAWIGACRIGHPDDPDSAMRARQQMLGRKSAPLDIICRHVVPVRPWPRHHDDGNASGTRGRQVIEAHRHGAHDDAANSELSELFNVQTSSASWRFDSPTMVRKRLSAAIDSIPLTMGTKKGLASSGITTPTVAVRFCTSPRARRFGVYPSSACAAEIDLAWPSPRADGH